MKAGASPIPVSHTVKHPGRSGDMVLTCEDCGQEFLSSSEYKRHEHTHLQTHLDKWVSNGESTFYAIKPLRPSPPEPQFWAPSDDKYRRL